MKKKEITKTDVSSKRVLGDEWKDWNQELLEKETEAPAGLFIKISVLSMLVFIALVFFIWFMISPRLNSISFFVGSSFKWSTVAIVLIFVMWSLIIMLEILFSIHVPFIAKTHALFIKIYFTIGKEIRKILHIDRDLFCNSFVKVSNYLLGEMKNRNLRKTVVLLPRCLKKEVREELMLSSKEKDVPAFVVGGGEQARRIIEKEKPDSVIAVACERDLVAGINDISGKIAVIGIPNKRPEGPCTNTSVDMEQFKKALKAFSIL
ncbi:MAG: DUF116 domain-containing protein [Candidatus Aureabacteria bacterium]|nr:DUF116 domain-containing protein [Candidatus Auribacterota bacterium]